MPGALAQSWILSSYLNPKNMENIGPFGLFLKVLGCILPILGAQVVTEGPE